jgi:hypothetical protein
MVNLGLNDIILDAFYLLGTGESVENFTSSRAFHVAGPVFCTRKW